MQRRGPRQRGSQRKASLLGGFALLLAAALASGCLVSFDGYQARGSGGSAATGAGAESNGGNTSGGKTGGGGKATAGSDTSGDAGEALGGEPSTGGTDAGGTAMGGNAGSSPGGGGSTSGSGGSAGSGGGSPKNCPTNLEGPSMIEVPKTFGGGFYCMDRTEVPNEDYAVFLATNPPTLGQVTECTWNNSYQPDTSTNCAPGSANYDPVVRPRVPVSCIDWCDAKRYCEWAGKHLCGKLGGGTNPPVSYIDPEASEWYRACSRAGTQKFPYGDGYQGTYCYGVDSPLVHPGQVANSANCEGGYDGLFDLSGNVAEWEDSCFASSGANDQCLIRGGSLENAETTVPSLLCNSSTINSASPGAASAQRSIKDEYIGFRCCFDW